ncbi:lysophospholipid acyltransferase family protein [Algihabitans albus]|uniref:lysophospholipid acyltransferase family protein n=1 Tax=Algihabitans albus TaxID=2164067 RepID=UPI000E5D2077|nr:lysophospholipid acyltransferase family protein [Algihabitans albus]
MEYPGSYILAIRRILLFVLLTLFTAPLQWLMLKLGSRLQRRIPHWYHRRVTKALGIEIVVCGHPSSAHPTLYVANHASYLDITVLGSLLKCSFVAKSEIADWPGFGLLAKLQRSVFVDRRRGSTGNHRDEMMRRLEAGDDLVLFPEGTSGDGTFVLPFKSALFSVAERRPHGRPLPVQPVSIAYTRLDGVPMGRYLRPFFAWYGDMDLGSHLPQALGMGDLTVVVEFHDPVSLDDFESRKALTTQCQAAVSRGLAAALSGRSLALPEGEALPDATTAPA